MKLNELLKNGKNMSYINFSKMGMSTSGLTERWEVRSEGNVQLGWISWFAAWRRYCFSPAPATIHDASCLREIADKCESLTLSQKGIKT